MLEYDWENSVGYWICMTSHEMRKALGMQLNQEGITLRQWEVLACLSSQGCGSQSELAEHLSIEPNTLAGVLSRMQKAGLLERKNCSEDRRRKRIHPTEKAEAVWKRVTAICHTMRAQAIAGLTSEEVALLKKLCGHIRQNVAQVIQDQQTQKADVA
ncbi:MAG: MarR family transcriptional regulator [Planctomycetaceae bacterium]|nr:MarR family transcriptional regulator [Planctomycetaceae bacterium]MCA9033181.1 MarR family transcriptional regulator [Planctomycetaceae bacterium]MCA9043812.1 MarR family transcriptional regulator [Planctomycetaceae bacterium]MCB9952528.1 MarR family transcriptional regulator [Planctomycetaceae bacterium]